MSLAASKLHVISFSKWTTVQWLAGPDEKPVALKIRALIVDGKTKEYVLGSPHEITDRLFVLRRVFRINDSLPEESGAPRWQWQRGGWLLVDRTTGHISPLSLPDFDALYSTGTWFRDYVAYCGVSEDGQKVFTIVAQLNRRKPVLKNVAANAKVGDESGPDSACSEPKWQRAPVRVTFETPAGKQTYAIRGHSVDLLASDEEDDDPSK